MKPKRVIYILFIVLMSSISMASLLYAYPYGRIGRSGKQGTTCSTCHFGTETPEVTLSGPTKILIGQTVDFSFTVDRNSDTTSVNRAGFNLAVSSGTLLGKDETPEECREPALGPPSHSNITCISVVDGLNEMSHARPLDFVDGKATFNMRYTAPITTGTVTFFGSGVAAVEGTGAFTTDAHSGNETFAIEILDPSMITPTAVITTGPITGNAPLTLMFDGSQSTDEFGSIVSYRWDFGDGNVGAGQIVTHTYQENGTYTISLEVEDNDGLKSSTSTTIRVGDYRIYLPLVLKK